MIRHIVFFAFQDTISEPQIETLFRQLQIITEEICDIVSMSWGKQLENADGNQHYTHALVIDFVDETAFTIYNQNPKRLKFAQTVAKPLLVTEKSMFVAMDYIIDNTDDSCTPSA